MTSSILILGARSDIGRAIGREYAKAGWSVILAARHAEQLAADAGDLGIRSGATARAVEFDVLDMAGIGAFLDGLGELPTAVVSVVGLLGDQTASAADHATAELVMRTNYLAPAAFLGEVANRMERRGSGSIIGISSVAGDRGRASNYVYGSAKAGFTAFLSGLRNRLASKGVRVLTVKPGFCRTRMTEGMKLPPLLTAEPAEVATAILAAEQRGRDVIYVRPIWRLVMLIIRCLPEMLFKRLKL